MAAKSTLKNMALCLTLVCLVCSAILAVIYAVTYDPIQAAEKKALTESIGQVLPDGGELSDVVSAEFDGKKFDYYVSTADGAPAAYAVKSTTVGFGGPLTLMVGVLPDGTVYNTSVLSHSETPGLGAKCNTDTKFMDQWKGLRPDKVIKVTKDGGDIDAITASTITSRAYSLAVSNAVAFVRSIANKEEE
ncbi:MAG: RnfABCDGE type electron transport complex subunit G [Bacteroidales bacterium]|jgi:electron transport complex, RnfABCDGE type, G subunit|nr:RnfABCDGE type electron transport complex subunit G [Bacteroidales bacterium]